MSNRWQKSTAPRGDDYDARWRSLAEAGHNVHGEADLVEQLMREAAAESVLDAGCGTGRVGIELARRGFSVTGVDADAGMLAAARRKAPELPWVQADLADLDTEPAGPFDAVLLAGNVMIFLEPGTEAQVMAGLSARLAPGGLLIAGFSVRPDRLPIERYDALAQQAGLDLVARWSTWDRQPFTDGDYAVSVHRTASPARR